MISSFECNLKVWYVINISFFIGDAAIEPAGIWGESESTKTVLKSLLIMLEILLIPWAWTKSKQQEEQFFKLSLCQVNYFTLQITKLKIDSNPFAKGFREATRTRSGEQLHHQHLDLRHSPYWQHLTMEAALLQRQPNPFAFFHPFFPSTYLTTPRSLMPQTPINDNYDDKKL